MSAKLLKKISIATFINPAKGEFKKATESVKSLPLMRIVGIARKFDTGISTFGEYVKFLGEFRATNLYGELAGEEAISAVAFLPAPVDGMLKEALAAQGNDGKSPVEFAFDISIVHDAKSENGYQYRVDTLTTTKASDPLAALMASVSAKPLPKLAAPVAEQELNTPATAAAENVTDEKPVAKGKKPA